MRRDSVVVTLDRDARPQREVRRETISDINLSLAKTTALMVASELGLALEEPFPMSTVSFVAPAGDVVIRVHWQGDDESLHEADAWELWDGDGAVRLLQRRERALLEERPSGRRHR